MLATLLTRERVLSLGVIVEGKPVVGVLPFLALPEPGTLLVHASRLARHSQGLSQSSAFGAAIQAPDHLDRDPLRVPRFTFEGRVEALPDGSETEAARRAWLERFENAAMTLELGDFSFWRLRIESGRLVLGFGRALNVGRSQIEEALAGRG
ncbi:MAG TPA: hypothetical protein VLL75_04660 [Vicinamibacteria bacterium]|nr:hypothetical protein [Vicinamibacteria bacterium]